MQTLFSPYRLGSLELPSRIVMAPMTRSRALHNVPTELMRQYYAQRASAGLIITEGIAPCPDALGYARIPGLFSAEQVAGWQQVTAAVHARGGRIVAQLMHVGRIAHPLNLPRGARVLAPSAVRAEQPMYTDQAGPQPLPEPEAMTHADLEQTRAAFAAAAGHAMDAGFDAVELHGANGYLLEQFLSPHTNRREDAYGGSVEKRARFVLEVVEAAAQAAGKERVGIRLSPYSQFNQMPAYDEAHAQYVHLARELASLGALYVHLVDSAHPGFEATASALRAAYGGPLLRNGGYDAARADQALRRGDAELISFGRPFIANPDFVERLRAARALAAPDPATFYSAGPEGYVDYPRAS